MNMDGGDAARPGGTRPYRMGARAAAVNESRERILQATYELWLAQPYDELTLDAVAERAGVTRQTVHRHFGSKDDLVMAVTAWRGPQEDEAREVAVGDVAGAVRLVVQRHEEMGDANVRMLELEGRVDPVDHMLAQGRRAHRAWIEQVFAPYLPAKGAARARAVDALYAATDVMVWKLLRRDFGRTAAQTQTAMRLLVDGALAAIADAGEVCP